MIASRICAPEAGRDRSVQQAVALHTRMGDRGHGRGVGVAE